MARGLTWSPEAVEDIEAIAAHIERDSPWYARAVASRIVETAETIPEFPELGRMVPEVGDPSNRERFAYSYRIIYRIEAERILVAAVIHGSRLLQPFLPRIE
ncbi:MAG: plasmid stabilization protein [Betaproteobacteria bacterium RIFCSPLOWO2_02_67_12]|nr:MAG: plasmid stabilization protein [Betaproteobacteria bacterium RIFCSPLOWO2_02_67_12]